MDIVQNITVSVVYLCKILFKQTATCWKHPRTLLYVSLLILFVLLFNAQPISIVRGYVGFVFLANVQHVLPLECVSDGTEPDWPRPSVLENRSDSNLTVLIVTARPEFKRLPVTIAGLLSHLDPRRISEVTFLVPPADVSLLEPYLSSEQARHWPWPISLVPDNLLLRHRHTPSYRLQMMFKLVAAQIVKTEYYLILDSDCLALWPIHVDHLLYADGHSSLRRAITPMEDKSGHAAWWAESEPLLQATLESCVSTNSSSIPTMSVTPIILSRTIALRTLCRLRKLYGDQHFLTQMARWSLWRLIFGRMWTEYTLYYLTARCTQMFDRYHFHQGGSPSVTTIPVVNLCGISIWWIGDWTSNNQHRLIEAIRKGLSWRRKEVQEANGQAIIDNSSATHSLFTVLQGRHGVNPIAYHQLFYPLYLNYLQERNSTESAVKLLERMTKKLVTT